MTLMNCSARLKLAKKNDQALAERALAVLKVLKGEVLVHSSLADFEEAGTLARVPYETFKAPIFVGLPLG